MSDENSLTHQIEQFGAMSCELAVVVGDYYKALIGAGVPEELAKVLTVSFHDQHWNLTKAISDKRNRS